MAPGKGDGGEPQDEEGYLASVGWTRLTIFSSLLVGGADRFQFHPLESISCRFHW
jgi:hypothetical protein